MIAQQILNAGGQGTRSGIRLCCFAILGTVASWRSS
jgi:hypothetical protein